MISSTWWVSSFSHRVNMRKGRARTQKRNWRRKKPLGKPCRKTAGKTFQKGRKDPDVLGVFMVVYVNVEWMKKWWTCASYVHLYQGALVSALRYPLASHVGMIAGGPLGIYTWQVPLEFVIEPWLPDCPLKLKLSFHFPNVLFLREKIVVKKWMNGCMSEKFVVFSVLYVDVDRKNVGFTRPGTHCDTCPKHQHMSWTPRCRSTSSRSLSSNGDEGEQHYCKEGIKTWNHMKDHERPQKSSKGFR